MIRQVTADKWHYMVISWDGEKVKIFVDAKEQFVGDLEGTLLMPLKERYSNIVHKIR